VGIGLLVRRLRQVRAEGDLALPESSVLARLDRDGPTTASALARLEQVSPQSMHTTVGELERRGLVAKHADPTDGRRVVVSLTRSGRTVLTSRRTARTEHMARALTEQFSEAERRRLAAAAPLLERLAHHI
jgi:DNA-binding MarR family transcriptional regulator